MRELPPGIRWKPDYLSRAAQIALLAQIRTLVKSAPLYQPTMPRTGKPLSVRMTNCGILGWVCDKSGGYRYQENHPLTNNPWPPIPPSLLQIWDDLSSCPHPPEACLINYYSDQARMGLHQDKDEEDFNAPVLSISLGDSCLFRVGGANRRDKTMSFKLHSGDVVILSGASRMAYHGVDKIYPGTSTLLNNGGRINLTLRRATPGSSS